MRTLTFILLIGITTGLYAQKKSKEKINEYAKTDKLALQVPDSLTNSAQKISAYINSNFLTQTDKSRAAFIWITNNIQYDIENLFAINFYQKKEESVEKVLATRKGICMHFAELYNAIANNAGIKTYVISGYTKQNGFVDYIPHAWCASMIDSTWYLIDATWGSGYIQNSKFVRKVDDSYFKIIPQQLLRSHIPFDPLWQFVNYPISNQEFYEGKIGMNKSKPFFNFCDSLKYYDQKSEIEKLVSASRRIEQNGVKNSLIFDRLQHTKREIEYYNNKMMVEQYNTAVSLYNEGVNQLNQFVDYRNKQFTPLKPDNEIKEMVDVAEKSLANSRLKMKEIVNPDQNTSNAIMQLNKSIDQTAVNLNEQRVFLNKYFSTNKRLRKTLFYKVTLMGHPIN